MRLVAFDLDGTLLKKNSSLAFCSLLFRRGILPTRHYAATGLTYFRHKMGGLSLNQLHASVFKAFFKGKDVALFDSYLEEFLDSLLPSLLYEPAIERLQSSIGKDHVIILSNSPSFMVTPIAKRLGVEEAEGSSYNIDGVGRLIEIASIMDGRSKRMFLEKRARELAAPKKVVYSDSFYDLPFLEGADESIAVKPDRKLASYAKRQGWEIL